MGQDIDKDGGLRTTTIYSRYDSAVMIFWSDVFTGSFLVIGLTFAVFGMFLIRYRGGVGPVLLTLSGVTTVVSTFLLIGSRIYDLPLTMAHFYLFFSVSFTFFLVSLLVWRK